ncbi:hypothetical protein NE237_004533 [Protea cynaroides]|uniref:Beta-galactosidase beta-sandwich domain-containing protein n=1 Tax=Protea cynaroides TaxID=273540 RepID=A0A9Q0KJ33_9MAGN|nr:hypothetical protein NE237_004533 [Protea cynaroides]
MVVGLGTGVPWVRCKEEDAPDPLKNTCNGYYCDIFTPNKPYKPTMWTEAWSGWYTEFSGTVHHRPVQDLAFAVARFIRNGAFITNNDPNSVAGVMFNNMQYNQPPWSISILPDCKNAVLNTTKVELLSWEIYDEDVSSLDDNSVMTAVGLLEQINVTRDTSDYLWYITSVEVGSQESFLHGGGQPTLIVQSTGHALHVFIIGQISGSAFGSRRNRRFRFTRMINNLRARTN